MTVTTNQTITISQMYIFNLSQLGIFWKKKLAKRKKILLLTNKSFLKCHKLWNCMYYNFQSLNDLCRFRYQIYCLCSWRWIIHLNYMSINIEKTLTFIFSYWTYNYICLGWTQSIFINISILCYLNRKTYRKKS